MTPQDAQGPTPICDLVLLSWNHLKETQPCLESLFATTGLPCRLFIVDNGSEPEVRAFLRSVKPRGAIVEVVLLQHETNEGFPRGMNRGIHASQAPFVCLLNNDLQFTTGWLEELLAVASTDPTVGVVNPSSSTLGEYPPRGMSLEAYAKSRPARWGESVEVGMCIGFCMLIKRNVLDRIGGLSEEVERIFFEDEDFSMRAQQAGFRCVVAAGSYVYHAEHKTVKKMPEREALFTRNQRWCNAQWGKRIRIAWPRFQPLRPGSPELRQWLETLLAWVRRRTHVYVYVPTPPGVTKELLFRSVGLAPHADIHWHRIPQAIGPWAATTAILIRRKKPFDVIAAPDDGWAKSLSSLRWLHRADVALQRDETALTAQWKARSRSPS